MTLVQTYLFTFKKRVKNLKRDGWLWSHDPQSFTVCGKCGYQSKYIKITI